MNRRLGQLWNLLQWCKRQWKRIEPHMQWFADKLGWSLRTTQRVFAKLKELGKVKINFRYRRPAVYEPITPEHFGGETGGTELKPEGVVLQRREEFSPLVVFLRTVQRVGAKTVKDVSEGILERAKLWGTEGWA